MLIPDNPEARRGGDRCTQTLIRHVCGQGCQRPHARLVAGGLRLGLNGGGQRRILRSACRRRLLLPSDRGWRQVDHRAGGLRQSTLAVLYVFKLCPNWSENKEI